MSFHKELREEMLCTITEKLNASVNRYLKEQNIDRCRYREHQLEMHADFGKWLAEKYLKEAGE